MEPFKANKRSAFHGRAQVIVQSARKPGAITLTAHAEGLPDAQVIVEAQ
jgi:beta-galactosidase